MDSIPVPAHRGPVPSHRGVKKGGFWSGRSDPSLAISLALHFALIGFFWVSGGLSPSLEEDAPEGVFRRGSATWVEVSSFQTQAFEKVKKTKPALKPVEDPNAIALPNQMRKQEKASSTEQDARNEETVLGHRDGTALEGELGVEGGRKASLRERYIYELRLLLEGRKVYPNLSRSMRETGRVWVAFAIDREGKIEEVSLKESSGFKRLDSAAVGLVEGLKRYRPIPEEIAGDSLRVQLPVDYILQ